MMKQRFPLLVALRLPKTLSVVLKCTPTHKQDILTWSLQAALQFTRQAAGRSSDYRSGLPESLLKRDLLTWPDLEDRHF